MSSVSHLSTFVNHFLYMPFFRHFSPFDHFGKLTVLPPSQNAPDSTIAPQAMSLWPYAVTVATALTQGDASDV